MSDVNINIKVNSSAAVSAINKTTQASKKLQDQASRLKNISGALGSFVGNLASDAVQSALRGIVNQTVAAVDAFADYETALVGVAKTNNFTAKQSQEFSKEIDKMAKSMPVATTGLLNIAQAGGQLGIATEDLSKFTETVAKVGVATDLAAEDAAIAFARILDLTGEGVQNIDRFSSALVDLGNNTKASESEIVSIATELAKSAPQYDINSKSILGLASTLKELGSEAEVSGSAFNLTLNKIANATVKGGEELNIFAKVTGQTAEQFKSAWSQDKFAVFQRFIQGLGNLKGGGDEARLVLNELGLSSQRLDKILPVLVGRYSRLEENLNRSNDAFKLNTALNQEAATAFSTLDSAQVRLDNTINQFRKNLIATYGDQLSSAIDKISVFVGNIADWVAENKDLTKTIINVTAALAGGAGLAGALLTIKLIGPPLLAALTLGMASLGKATIVATAGLALIPPAIYLIWENWEKIEGYITSSIDVLKKWWEGLTTKFKRDWLSLMADMKLAYSGLLSALGFAADKLGLDIADSFKNASSNAKKEAMDAKKSIADELEKEEQTRRDGFRKAEKEYAKELVQDEYAKLKEMRKAESEYTGFLLAEKEKRGESTGEKVDSGVSGSGASLMKLEEFNTQKLELEKEFFANKRLLEQEQRALDIESKQFKNEEDILALQNVELTKINIMRQAEIEKANLIKDSRKRELEIMKANNKANIAEERLKAQQSIEIEKFREKRRQDIQNVSLQATSNFLNAGASLAREGSETQRKLQSAQAIVSTYTAANQAMSMPPGPPFTLPLVASVVAQGIANVSRINSQRFASGGIVKGSSSVGDAVEARVNSGEMVLNKNQQTSLFNSISSGNVSSSGNNQDVMSAINTLGDRIQNMQIVVMANDDEIARSVGRGVENGIVIGNN